MNNAKDQIGIIIFLILFFVAGAMFIAWGDADGNILPSSNSLGPLWFRISFGSTLIISGAMSFLAMLPKNSTTLKCAAIKYAAILLSVAIVPFLFTSIYGFVTLSK